MTSHTRPAAAATSPRPETQAIVQVGGEGGSLTLYGVQSPAGWRFCASTSEAALYDEDDVGEGDGQSYSPRALGTGRSWVTSWRSALKQLDTYPWPQLYPMAVHPEFSVRVFNALQLREKKGRRIDWWCWNKVLGRTSSGR